MKTRIQLIQQRAARLLGRRVAIDGVFGPQTASALDDCLTMLETKGAAIDESDSENVFFDERTEDVIETLHPNVQDRFRELMLHAIEEAAKVGLTAKMIGGTRTWEEQASLYAQGRTTSGEIVTNAGPGQSWHNFGVAVDFGLFRGGDYIEDNGGADAVLAKSVYQAVAERMHEAGDFFWGGHWTQLGDFPHFHLRVVDTLAEARRLYLAGDWFA